MLHPASPGQVLIWGRSDTGYSRNRMVRQLFGNLGWQITTFFPSVSQLGWVQAHWRALKKPNLVWVPCFRQKDMASAAVWARKWRIPLVFDPLISAYQKDVDEKKKFTSNGWRGKWSKRRECRQFQQADIVVADTAAHADFYQNALGVTPTRLKVLYVGAEPDLFMYARAPRPEPPYDILFFGSFLPLQGVDTIIEAAKLLKRHDARWTLLGHGDMHDRARALAAGCAHIHFEPWIDYPSLPRRIARAHILLGVFGDTPKANMVIPNKVFQSMAVGRPLITRMADGYRNSGMDETEVIGWVPAADAHALAAKIDQWLRVPDWLAERGKQTRQLFDRCIGFEKMTDQMKDILETVHRLP